MSEENKEGKVLIEETDSGRHRRENPEPESKPKKKRVSGWLIATAAVVRRRTSFPLRDTAEAVVCFVIGIVPFREALFLALKLKSVYTVTGMKESDNFNYFFKDR